MQKVRLSMPIYLPGWLYRAVRKRKDRILLQSERVLTPNLLGDRDIEWSWVASQIPPSGGDALDFGAGNSSLGLVAALRGFKVVAMDLTPPHLYY